MKKEDIAGILVVIFAFLSGIAFGGNFFPKKVPHYIGDEISTCEEAGGNFSIFKSSFDDKYIVQCKSESKDLIDYEKN